MDKHFTIYPIYFDSSKRCSEGRKYPINMCITSPTITEMVDAFKMLEIETIPEYNKRHPRDPFIFGRVKVPKHLNKKSVINGLKVEIEKLRMKKKEIQESKTESVSDRKGYIKNDLNLIPKKKKKGKKSK